jgi:hypothetical protein
MEKLTTKEHKAIKNLAEKVRKAILNDPSIPVSPNTILRQDLNLR